MATIIGLRQLAKQSGIKVQLADKKQTIIDALVAIGIDPEATAEERKEIKLDEIKTEIGQLLVKMERSNSTFTFAGHRFTQKEPYCLMDDESANCLFNAFDGFRIASAQEVMGFYCE